MLWFLLACVGLAILPQTALAGQFDPPVYYHMGLRNNLPLAIVSADFNGDATSIWRSPTSARHRQDFTGQGRRYLHLR
jgi:hypothetical protein